MTGVICCLFHFHWVCFKNTDFFHLHWVNSERWLATLYCACNKCCSERTSLQCWMLRCSLETTCHLCTSWTWLVVCSKDVHPWREEHQCGLSPIIYYFFADMVGTLERFMTVAANGHFFIGQHGSGTGGINVLCHLAMTSWMGSSLHQTVPCRAVTATWGQRWPSFAHERQSTELVRM